MTSSLEAFAAEVGEEGPVCCAGGRTQWEVGGAVDSGTREVAAPAGVMAHEPAEMIVRVRAGTPLGELREVLVEGRQRVALEGSSEATVGGVVSVGHSGVRRLGWGPVRDAVLEVTAVNWRGELIRSGAPLVKNVTGFDLCRLLTGSLGTLGIVAEVVLRCVPLPDVERWYAADGADPFELYQRLYRPLSILWDGTRTWVGLSGVGMDVEEQAGAVLGEMFSEVDGPPDVPGPGRRSMAPASLRSLPAVVGDTGAWLAEVGVGVVHCDSLAVDRLGPVAAADAALVDLHRRIKESFDPVGRMNPGRRVLEGAAL